MEKDNLQAVGLYLLNSDQMIPAEVVAKMLYPTGNAKKLHQMLKRTGFFKNGKYIGKYKRKIIVGYNFIPEQIHSSCIADIIDSFHYDLQVQDVENSKKREGKS